MVLALHGRRERAFTRSPPAGAGGFLATTRIQAPGASPGTPGRWARPDRIVRSRCMDGGSGLLPGVPQLAPGAFWPPRASKPRARARGHRAVGRDRIGSFARAAWTAGAGFCPESPSWRRGLFGHHAHTSPGREPGDTGPLGEPGPDRSPRDRLAAGMAAVYEPAATARANRVRKPRDRLKSDHFTSRSSTRKWSVASGGITGGAPRRP
jgi:hypothetical protein